MTAREAARTIKLALAEKAIPHTTVHAQTVSFSDLARGERVFVTIEGWQRGYESPSRYAWLADIAKKNGFSVEVKS